MSQQKGSWLAFAKFLSLSVSPVVFFLPIVVSAQPCDVPDNGSGTVTLPPAGCAYLSSNDVHMIIDGLPVGTTIELAAVHRDFICCNGGENVSGEGGCNNPQEFCNFPGGSLGGEVEQFDSILRLAITSSGLAGFPRTIDVPAFCEVHTGPRTLGDPIQTFANDMFSLQGSVAGDPDFDLLRITAGTSFGMPGPGETTLTQLPNGAFQVDSFFDISYAITFVGAQGGVLAGMSGTTTGSVRMGTSSPPPGCVTANCDDGIACTVDSCDDSLGTCLHVPDDATCDDGVFCNGAEVCSLTLGCQPGTPPNCDDGVACTADTCNEHFRQCDHAPNDSQCSDGRFCNGNEHCDAILDCQPGTPPDCDDGNSCTLDTCNDSSGVCEHVGQDQDGDGVCDGEDECPHSILTSTVIIRKCDSAVANDLFENGCTMSDQIAECAAAATNHGTFVGCVSNLTNRWNLDGVISGSQKGRIQNCAAKDDVGTGGRRQ